MTTLAIDTDTFKWLQSLQIVKQGKRNSDNKIQLPQNVGIKFFDGILISKIIQMIIQKESQINQTLLTKMKSIKQNSTPAIRLYNWNLILDVLKFYKYSVDYVQKSKILNLQAAPLVKILTYLKGIYKNQNGNRNDYSTIQNSSSLSSLKDKEINNNPLQVDIKTISGKVITESMNIMQFFVISLSKNFKLSPQHTLNLFLDNNKYLAHLLVKGIKQSFDPIINFQNQIVNHLEFIILNLFSIEQQKSLQFFFQGLKSCLISKNFDVALKCLFIFQKVHKIYSDNKLDQTNLLSWFRKQGVNMLLFSTKRHQQTLQEAIKISYKIMENELFEFIRPVQKSPLWASDSQKLQFYNSFLFVAQNTVLKSFKQSTCLMQWNKYCLKSLKKLKSTIQQKLLIRIMHRKWIQFPKSFQQDNGLAQTFISFLKSTSFSNDFMLFIDSIKTMFDLMEVLGKRKNSYAPVFYKTLINCLSFQSAQERVVFIVQNFISVFHQIQSLPGSLLVQPLLKSIERNCTTSSLNLCRMLIIQQKVKQQESSEIVDVMTKVLFEDINQGSLAIQYIFQSLRVLDQEVQNQFLVKNSQLCLSHLYSLSKSIKKTFQDLMQSLRKYGNEPVSRQIISNNGYLAQVRKYLLIQNLMKFIQQIIRQDYQEVVKQLQEPIFMTYIKVKHQVQKQQIALILYNMILKKYYDIEEELIAVIDKYQQKYQAYLNALNKRNFSRMNSSEQQESPIKQSHVIQSRLYASKSLILDQTPQIKKVKPDIFKPEKSAIKDLELLKSRMVKLKLATQQNEKQKDIMQQKKDLVRSIINQRRLVRYGAKYTTDFQYRCIYQFDSVKNQKNINGLPNIQITDLPKQQQDIFVADVDSLMKKYRKVWRFLFFKYSTFGAKNTSQPKIQQKINMAEVWKMHRDYNADFIKKQQSFAIVKLVNQNMKRKHDLQNLTYLGFQEYVVQFCIFAYNKIGLSTLSPGQKVGKLLNQFKSVTQQKGGNVQIFQNPEEVYMFQTEVIKQFNKRLLQNPDYILPEGYKKIKQTEFIYDYEFTEPNKQTLVQVNKNVPKKKSFLSQSYFAVLQVLDSIFYQSTAFGFHLLQPKTTKTQKILAKPALFQHITQKMKNYKQGYLMPKRQINSLYIENKQKVNPNKPEFHPLIQFSLGIKLGLAGVNIKYKYIGQQVAYWMDDMLDAIENGSPKVGNKAKKQIQNEALKRKKQILVKLKQDMKQKQKIYKQRSQSVKSQFEKIQVVKVQNKKKRIQDIKAKRQQQKQKHQQQMKKKLSQFQKAKQYFSQKHQKQKQRIRKEQQIKKVQKQEYKKKVEEYFKLKKEQLQQKQLNYKKEKQFQRNKQKQQKEKHKQFTKKIYFSVLKKDQQALEKIQSVKDKYQQFANQSFVLEEFQIHKKSLTLLFQLLLKYQKSKISATDKNQISQITFNFFTIKFKIVPFILQKNILSKIFISIGKEQAHKAGYGISYRGFQQALLKIIVKSKKTLNDLVQTRRKKLLGQSNVSIKQPSQQGGLNDNKSSLQNSQMASSKLMINQNVALDYLFDPEGVSQQTIRQFMLFLNLPDDKLGIQQRFREAVESKNTKPLLLIKKQLKQELNSL